MCCNNAFCNYDSNIENFTEVNRTPTTGNVGAKGLGQRKDHMGNFGANAYSSGQLNAFKTQATIKESYSNARGQDAFVGGFAGATTG